MTTTEQIAPGDVVRYQPERRDGWCREGTALASYADSKGVILRDTYWSCGGEEHVLTAAELRSAEVLFNLADYDELDQYAHSSRSTWATYAPADRRLVTSQHGLQRRYFIRKGAQPDRSTMIQNARDAVTEAERSVDSARRDLEWRRRQLAEIEAAS